MNVRQTINDRCLCIEKDMLSKARLNASKVATNNITFIHSRITDIDMADGAADVVISNCVINLVPHGEKHLVFKEIFRVLKPGGRLAVSDILTRKDLPEQMKNDLALYVGCVAGASRKEEYEMWMKEAGFEQVLVVDAGVDLNMYTRADEQGSGGGSCCQPAKVEASGKGCCGDSVDKVDKVGVVEGMKTNFRDTDLNEWAGEYHVPRHECVVG